MFRKYHKNLIKLSCMNKEKTVTACSYFEKINKVYKKSSKSLFMLLLIFLYNTNNKNWANRKKMILNGGGGLHARTFSHESDNY